MALNPKTRSKHATSTDEPVRLEIELLERGIHHPSEKHHRQTDARRDSPLMVCYGPMRAYYPKQEVYDAFQGKMVPNPEKKLVFRKDKSETGVGLKIPCGKCAGCRLEQSRQWAMRCMHEKKMHPGAGSAFVTLTYDDKYLPKDYGLHKPDLQNFMKRLRNNRENGLRFFACGEYGEKLQRPHYHILLFNTSFPDMKKNLNQRANQHDISTSAELSQLWPYGQNFIGEVTFDSCAYVARYISKKLASREIILADGRKLVRDPEFTCMSMRPGLGTAYYEKYGNEIHTHDSVVVRGYEVSPPRFYDEKLRKTDPARYEEIKKLRRRRIMKLSKADNTQARLRVREIVSLAKLATKGSRS
ncbi:replication initiator protein [Blackfly microvirus SF02]|uniref:Replication initiator protein n=1 Tax=Blackfly microvirus SF02 TaxID=2576452 RepID=A0A4P8PP58_9VIRU|nr:replication initiator protein [Blackfly microvirus SF02]